MKPLANPGRSGKQIANKMTAAKEKLLEDNEKHIQRHKCQHKERK